MNNELITALKDIKNIRFSENEPMSKHTTFKIGGPARLYIEISESSAVTEVIPLIKSYGISPVIIGNGSNLLFPDEGIDGVVIKLTFNKISVNGTSLITEAGALLSVCSVIALKNSLSGLEFAQGIPGSVGGALIMNAGAYGSEIADCLVSSTYLCGDKVFTLSGSEHDFSYRNSFYKKNPELLVLSAEFSLTPSQHEEISLKMRDFASRRREKQPLELPSAGSVFKRPQGHFAGALIEQCNLKGYSIGGAEVSKKHAGFIVNRGEATANDVKSLIYHIQETVLKETGVSLECEICIL